MYDSREKGGSIFSAYAVACTGIQFSSFEIRLKFFGSEAAVTTCEFRPRVAGEKRRVQRLSLSQLSRRHLLAERHLDRDKQAVRDEQVQARLHGAAAPRGVLRTTG